MLILAKSISKRRRVWGKDYGSGKSMIQITKQHSLFREGVKQAEAILDDHEHGWAGDLRDPSSFPMLL